ncbi:hypothetical protein [Streptomyces sp. BE133]|uniref:hypothetical protein n=1 Tax=Streptomyces sp. BE133 TaxID=3002523 RepID=UPI002E7A5AA6|nr:hypothetical protein [Streptomyces sp. BE133]MEE1812643.1 hypothetical protein [Streptomyces sp. BE133]
MTGTDKIRAAVFARTPDGQTLYAREAAIEVTAQDSQEAASATAGRPIDYLRGIAHGANHAINLTKENRPDEAKEHVDAIERLIAAYRAAAPKES